ncbi:DUF4870 domain-containing protein [Thermomonospora umbrina]|uniref:Tic20 family protein n=1 Tax=Thermomonospora umbrina TaxID=111806 RepID=A0A3D9ST78_9ACTN|nr:DUF4870 domain-containing protein [Thermomonospora umbrina]REE99169.1 hypothetical protein DFJ69_4676 [Thermomonospora umbrina]
MTGPPGPHQPPPGYQYQYGHGPHDQWYGYGPPGVPNGPSGDDTTWALMAYLGTLIVGFIAPLIVYFAKKNTSPFSRFHAAQSLNYGITVLIHMLVPLLVAIPLAIVADDPIWFLLAVPMVVFHAVAQWVFLILGTVKAGQGRYYRFPVWTCFRMIR